MKIKLTSTVVVGIQADYRQRVKDAEAALAAVKADYAEALRLLPGQEFNFDNGQITPAPATDIRPEGWKHRNTVRVPSRSGGPDHEITSGEGSTRVCNCDAHLYGHTCWAVQSLQSGGVRFDSRTGKYFISSGGRNYDVHSQHGAYRPDGFGAARTN